MSEDNIKIGKLVLVRTFVVLRHWIINYFIDDFNNNNELCDYFTNTINKITLESNLIPQQQQQEQQTRMIVITVYLLGKFLEI